MFGTGAGYTKDASGLRPAPTVLGVGKKEGKMVRRTERETDGRASHVDKGRGEKRLQQCQPDSPDLG